MSPRLVWFRIRRERAADHLLQKCRVGEPPACSISRGISSSVRADRVRGGRRAGAIVCHSVQHPLREEAEEPIRLDLDADVRRGGGPASSPEIGYRIPAVRAPWVPTVTARGSCRTSEGVEGDSHRHRVVQEHPSAPSCSR